MKKIQDIDLSGQRVFIRVDFNVPFDQYQNITDDSRIRAVLATLNYALDHDAKLIIASHKARPEGKVVEKDSLAPVAKRLGRLLKKEIKMAPDCIGPKVSELISNMEIGDVVLLENLRFHAEEQKNDEAFAKELAALCDVYINDAFAVSHRVNASVEAILKYVKLSGAGFLLQKELDYFEKAISDPSRPLVAIVGGAKVSSKLGAIKNMLHHVDKLIIGGAMANTFLTSMGFDLGKSKIESELVVTAGSVIKMAKEKGIKLYTPVDAVIAQEIDSKASTKIAPVQEIPADWMALDIGPATSLLFSEVLYDSKTIIWNGPMGIFEIDAFSRGTLAMVSTVANSYALSIVGGGDTDVAVHRANETDRMSYISTGGGAFLALLEGKTLPAVAALESASG